MKITGRELELNDGGPSQSDCPDCGKKLRKHKTSKGRFFCKHCGSKFEGREEGFYEVKNKMEKIELKEFGNQVETMLLILVEKVNKLIEWKNEHLF